MCKISVTARNAVRPLAVRTDAVRDTVVPLTVTVAQVGHVPLFDILFKRQSGGGEETRPLIRGNREPITRSRRSQRDKNAACYLGACSLAHGKEGGVT